MNASEKFIESIRLLKKWFWFLTLNFLVVCAAAVFISLQLPKYYRASTVLVLPNTTPLSGVSSILANLPIKGLGGGSGGDIYRLMAILHSRTIMEQTVERFDLVNKYEAADKEKAVKELRGNAEFVITEEGTLEISIYDKDPQAAADMANTFARLLDKKNRQLDSDAAKNNRLNIEKRLEENKKALEKSQDDYRAFQEKYNAISLTEQTEQAIGIIAQLTGNKYQVEVELEALKKSLGPNHSQVIQLEMEVSAYNEKIDKISYEPSGYDLDAAKARDLFIPLNKVPELGSMLIDLKREMETQNQIYLVLTQQLELAKIEEVKVSPSLQIIDEAVPPLRKVKPKRAFIVIMAGMSALILSVLFIAVYEFYKYAGSRAEK